MGLLVIFFIGVFAVIIIAKLAAKMRPEAEKRLFAENDNGHQKSKAKQATGEHDLDEENPKETLDALITILTRKQILNPDELLIEIAANRKTKQ